MGLRLFGRWLADWYRAQTPALRILLVAITLLAGKLVDQALDFGKYQTGLAPWLIAALIIGACATVGLVSLTMHRRGKVDPLPPVNFAGLQVCRTFSPAELDRLRSGLHADIYEGSAPDNTQVERIYAKNPRLGVALFDVRRDDYVAFAAAWPLRDEAAERLMAGLMTENELTSADILRACDNPVANYVLIPAFGAAGFDSSSDRKLLGVRLYFELRKALRQNFFAAGSRPVTLIATGFSAKGREWCRDHEMDEKAQIHMSGVAEPIPIFAKVITLADVD